MSKRASPALTSGSEEDVMDERKRRRMESNRESARRSRMRKQQHLDGLINQVAQLKEENSQILVQVDMLTQQFVRVESENGILRAQVMALTERLQFLNSVLRIVENVSGTTMDIPALPEPWQLSCPAAQPITAAAHMFQC